MSSLTSKVQIGAAGVPAASPKRPYRNTLAYSNRLGRALWNIVNALLYRTSPRPFHGWRRFLLRQFGANIAPTAHPYPYCRIYAPWNLTMKDHSCLADHVDCYSVDRIVLGVHATVSQYSHLCSATHDYTDPEFPLVTRPICLGDYSWVAAGAFIGPGVSVGAGAVIGARSVVVRDVEPWAVVAGNPARFVKRRVVKSVIP